MRILLVVLFVTVLAGADDPPCRSVHGMPDSSCTPGAVETSDRGVLCGQRTRERRRVSEALRRRVFEAYGVPAASRGQYRIDHRVPVCAGGSSDEKNLWPEPLEHSFAKDKVEVTVCAAICDGVISPEEAQRLFLGDWTR